VRFRAALPDEVDAKTCTCSICEMTGFVHVIVPASRFELTRGQDALSAYRFNTGVAQHLFCRTCGVESFYRPRSNPDGWSVNARCLDEATRPALALSEFDGRNWEAHAGELAHLSEEAS
jgi:hypothetical protein